MATPLISYLHFTDGKINRASHEGPYRIGKGMPMNVRGRTGMEGRGVLGRYGPNHAADPIVTRWKRDEKGKQVYEPSSGRPVLQFVAIQRRDTNEWAIPGGTNKALCLHFQLIVYNSLLFLLGMVDPGEQVSVTVRREFMEEALDSGSLGSTDKSVIEEKLKSFFDSGKELFKGYVDDPRNTDNAWMETVAFLFHDPDGSQIGN